MFNARIERYVKDDGRINATLSILASRYAFPAAPKILERILPFKNNPYPMSACSITLPSSPLPILSPPFPFHLIMLIHQPKTSKMFIRTLLWVHFGRGGDSRNDDTYHRDRPRPPPR